MRMKSIYSQEQMLLLKAIEQAVEDLNSARIFFENANDPRLVDVAIYQEEAARAKYSYLIYQAKQKGLKAEAKYCLLEENEAG